MISQISAIWLWHVVLFANQAVDPRLNVWGWTVMLLSVGSVLALVTFCMYRVLSLPPVEQECVKGPLEIDTGDTEDAD